MSPARRRDAVAYLQRRHKVSERRACQLVGQHRSTQRYQAQGDDFELKLVAEMNRLADANPRWGYRRIHVLLVEDGWAVNRKRIERLWRAEGHRVPPRRKKRLGNEGPGVAGNSAWNRPAVAANHVWSYDFMTIRLDDGTGLRVLNVVDEFTRECLGSFAGRNIGARDVQRRLEDCFRSRGTKPKILRSDNGREFTADVLLAWLANEGIGAAAVEKGSPQQNCFVERFNGTMRDELLNGEWFHSLTEARVVIGEWVDGYNTRRPHRGLGMRTPVGFAADHRAESSDRGSIGSSR